MRLTPILWSLLLTAACDDDHHSGAYADLQDCFDDHVGPEGLTVEESLVICTLEHPEVGGANFSTAAECVTFVKANLDLADATDAQITAACDEYIVQKES